MSTFFLGIDIGNTYSVFYLMDCDGRKIDCDKVMTLCEAEWRVLLEPFKGKDLRACFEATTHYGWLYELLSEYSSEVAMINPGDFAVISRSQKKTDKIDAQKLAEGLRRGDLPTVHVPEKRIREDRRLVSFVHWHSRRLADIKQRIRALLLPYRLKCPFKNVMGVGGQNWLNKQAMEKLDEQGRVFLRMLIEEARLLMAHRAELDARVVQRVSEYEESAIVRSVPGVGALVALGIVSAIAGIGRFKSAKELASYFGVCGSVHQSGQSLKLGSVTRRGSIHVRWLLTQALRVLHCRDSRARQRYLRLRKRKRVSVARAAQVRWLTTVLWHILKKNEPYRIRTEKLAA